MFLVNRYGNLVGQTYIRLEEAGFLAHNSRFVCGIFPKYTSVDWRVRTLVLLKLLTHHRLLYDPLCSVDS